MGTVPSRLNGPPARPRRRALSPLKLHRKLAVLCASAIIHAAVLAVVSQLVLLSPSDRKPHNQNVTVDLRPAPARDLLDDIMAAIRQHRSRQTDASPDSPDAASPPIPAETENDADRAEDDHPETEAPAVVSVKSTLALGEGRRPSMVANRSPGGKRNALRARGGSAASESAVKAALRWLMRHQGKDGKWSCRGFTGNCDRASKCGGGGSKAGIDPGLTGLALLAFLSGGSHPADGTEFGRAVARGTQYLLRCQESCGRFGPFSAYEMYNHSIATLAVAEAHILSGDKALREPLRRAVNYIVEAQQAEGGWDYTTRRTGRNDTSVTGFVVMALKSADAAGIEVPWMVIYGVIEHFDRMTRKSGEAIYANRGVGSGRAGLGMVAVSALSRQFLGWPADAEILRKQYAIMRRNPPRWDLLNEDAFHNMYYWYYGTLAMFQAGGKDWELWNSNLRDMLIRHQRREGCAGGSWDPAGKWLGKAAGRVYATAINAMNLQVYYRYLPVYEAPSLNSVEALVRASSAQGDMRIRAVRILAEFRDRQSREALVRSLDDQDPFMRLNAAIALLAHDDVEEALPVLMQLSRDDNGFIRSRAVDELVKLDKEELIPVFIERLNDQKDFIAARAAAKLRRMCCRNFNFDTDASESEKDQIVADWRQWYMEYRAGEVRIDKSQVFGSVINVKPAEVMLDVGLRDTVKTGDDFEVIRRGRVIARVKVFRVLQQFSAARIVLAEDGASIREKDIVKRAGPRS